LGHVCAMEFVRAGLASGPRAIGGDRKTIDRYVAQRNALDVDDAPEPGHAAAQGQEALDAPAFGAVGHVRLGRDRPGLGVIVLAHLPSRSLRTRAISSSATLSVFSWLPLIDAEVTKRPSMTMDGTPWIFIARASWSERCTCEPTPKDL